MYISSLSLYVENKMKKPAPAIVQMSSSFSNFFTKCTVAFHFWKATVHFVFIKKSISPSGDHRLYWYFHPNFFSLSSHFIRNFLSLLLISSLLSLVSLLFRWLGFLLSFLLKHKTGWLRLAGVVLGLEGRRRGSRPGLGFAPISAWGGCARRSRSRLEFLCRRSRPGVVEPCRSGSAGVILSLGFALISTWGGCARRSQSRVEFLRCRSRPGVVESCQSGSAGVILSTTMIGLGFCRLGFCLLIALVVQWRERNIIIKKE